MKPISLVLKKELNLLLESDNKKEAIKMVQDSAILEEVKEKIDINIYIKNRD